MCLKTQFKEYLKSRLDKVDWQKLYNDIDFVTEKEYTDPYLADLIRTVLYFIEESLPQDDMMYLTMCMDILQGFVTHKTPKGIETRHMARLDKLNLVVMLNRLVENKHKCTMYV